MIDSREHGVTLATVNVTENKAELLPWGLLDLFKIQRQQLPSSWVCSQLPWQQAVKDTGCGLRVVKKKKKAVRVVFLCLLHLLGCLCVPSKCMRVCTLGDSVCRFVGCVCYNDRTPPRKLSPNHINLINRLGSSKCQLWRGSVSRLVLSSRLDMAQETKRASRPPSKAHQI